MNIWNAVPLLVATVIVLGVYGLALWKGSDDDVQTMRRFVWLWVFGLCLTIFL